MVDWRWSQRQELEGRQRSGLGSFTQPPSTLRELSRSGAASNTQQGPSLAAYRPLANGKLDEGDPLFLTAYLIAARYVLLDTCF